MSYEFEGSELTKEKSLWEIYKLSRSIRPNKFQFFIVSISIVLLTVNAFVLNVNTSDLLSDVRLWADKGFDFSITTLGFLIAGFAIFSTLSKPEMLLKMMAHKNKATNLPTLKYNFFVFMKVFIFYIFYSVVYLSIILFGQKGGFFGNFINLLPESHCIKIVLIKISYVVVGGSFVYLLFLLKSFVFNIYAIVMTFLRWEHLNRDQNNLE
jgi:hypothetical protein